MIVINFFIVVVDPMSNKKLYKVLFVEGIIENLSLDCIEID